MAYYYVKSGGTAVGDAGRSVTARTGGFAAMGVSAYYNSVYDVFAGLVPTTLPDGDIIVISNLHIESYAVSTTLLVQSVTSGAINTLVSKSDVDVSVYLSGALIEVTTGSITICSYIQNKNNLHVIGVNFNAQAYFKPNGRASSTVFELSNINQANNYFYGYNMYGAMYKKCVIDCSYIRTISSTVKFNDCDIKFYSSSGIRDCSAYFYYCDFSRSVGSIKPSYSSSSFFYNCIFPIFPMTSNTIGFGHRVTYTGCGTTNEYYQLSIVDALGLINTNISTYLNYKYDGTNKASYKLESNSKTEKANTLKIKLCEIPAQDLSVTDITYRVNLLLDTGTRASLTDSEFWIELSHNDNTSLALGKIVSSRNTDILAAGTELTASAEVWQGTLPATSQAYQVDIVLSAASLPNVTNGSVVVYANLAVPNVDVYVDPAVQIGT